jgi:hypothetical protein
MNREEKKEAKERESEKTMIYVMIFVGRLILTTVKITHYNDKRK